MNTEELYNKYINEYPNIRQVQLKTFNTYLKRFGWYDNTIEYLKKPNSIRNNKAWYTKWGNISEIVDFAKLFSIKKAAKEYWVSERTIYRYINK